MISILKKKRKIVLDTSLFINPEIRYIFGKTSEEAISEFLKIAKKAKNCEFFLPTTVFNELMHFVDESKIPKDFYYIIRIKSPNKYRNFCPAIFFYDLIEEIRVRINKGLRVAESAVRNVTNRGVDETIKDLRKKYREALREGIIDSKEDVDLIFLCIELKATLVSADAGLIKWADKFGIEWIMPKKFKEFLQSATF